MKPMRIDKSAVFLNSKICSYGLWLRRISIYDGDIRG